MKYEYKIEVVGAKSLRFAKLSIEQRFNAFGEEGWELVSATPREFMVLGTGMTHKIVFCFKRAIPDIPQKFEYKVEVTGRSEVSGKGEVVEQTLNSCNKDGWEYLSAVPHNLYLYGCGFTWLFSLFFMRRTLRHIS